MVELTSDCSGLVGATMDIVRNGDSPGTNIREVPLGSALYAVATLVALATVVGKGKIEDQFQVTKVHPWVSSSITWHWFSREFNSPRGSKRSLSSTSSHDVHNGLECRNESDLF